MEKLDTNRIYYTYVLNNPLTGLPFYVGKGQGNRMYKHEKNTRNHRICNGTNGYLYREIKSILQASASIQYEIANDDMTEEEAFALEAAYITDIGLDNLCNIRPPGLDTGKGSTGDTSRRLSNVSPEEAQRRRDINGLGSYRHQINKCGTMEDYTSWRDSQYHERQITKIDHTNNVFSRICPKCNKETIHNDYNACMTAGKHKVNCPKCIELKSNLSLLNQVISDIRRELEAPTIQIRKEVQERKRNAERIRIQLKKENSPFKRNCPKCNALMGYSTKKIYSKARRNNVVCCSCSTKRSHNRSESAFAN